MWREPCIGQSFISASADAKLFIVPIKQTRILNAFKLNSQLVKARTEARALAIIALPVIVAQLLQMGMGVADTLMAGRVSALALSAVAMGAAMWFFTLMAGLGLMLALTPIIAHHVGANNHSLIREELRQGVWLALVLSVFQMLTMLFMSLLMPWIGVAPEIVAETRHYLMWVAWSMPFTCLYLVPRFLNESMGHTMPMLWTQLLMLPVNVLGNYALMFGNFGFPAMGASGAALSTGIAQTIGCLALCAYTLSAPLRAVPAAPAHQQARLEAYRQHRAFGYAHLNWLGHGVGHVHRDGVVDGALWRRHGGGSPDCNQRGIHFFHGAAGYLYCADCARRPSRWLRQHA